jgi:hypothetical protein
MTELPWKESEIRQGLILFRTSNNAHGHTNFSMLSHRVDNLPQVAKDELARTMVNIAHSLSPDAMSALERKREKDGE